MNISGYDIKENQLLYQIFEFFNIIELFFHSVFFQSCSKNSYSRMKREEDKRIRKNDRGNSLKVADTFPLTTAKQESEYALENEPWEREKKKKKGIA